MFTIELCFIAGSTSVTSSTSSSSSTTSTSSMLISIAGIIDENEN
jgi:hypothetical protein